MKNLILKHAGYRLSLYCLNTICLVCQAGKPAQKADRPKQKNPSPVQNR